MISTQKYIQYSCLPIFKDLAPRILFSADSDDTLTRDPVAQSLEDKAGTTDPDRLMIENQNMQYQLEGIHQEMNQAFSGQLDLASPFEKYAKKLFTTRSKEQ